MNDVFHPQSFNVQLDPSIKSITKEAAYALSDVIGWGATLALNPNPDVIIFKDRIEFGKCFDPKQQGQSGRIFKNFFIESGNIIYRFNGDWSVSFLRKKLDYRGNPPMLPDPRVFAVIYPRFAKPKK